MQNKEIFEKVSKIISPIFLIGGCCRDELLGKEPSDFDFASPLTPDEMEKMIVNSINEHGDKRKCYNVGKKFGTVAFKMEGMKIELTTFRYERYDGKSRKPEVEFITDIKEDLARRDFTINAIAYDGINYIDPYGGKFDLMSKVIKCVKNPKERFKEDPLRMFRMARFASQLEFSIDINTEKHATKMAHRILFVSKERWVEEMDKLLMSDIPSIGLEVLAETRLLNFILPEIAIQVGYDQNSPWHPRYNLWDHTKKVVDLVPKDINMRWAALLHDMGKNASRTENKKGHSNYIKHDLIGAEIVTKIASYLKWSNERTKAVRDLVYYHLREESPLREYDHAAK